MRRVTIKDIARIAKVSVTTVSRALNGSSDISEETRSRILKICRREGYHVNLLAKSLISSRTNVLGVVLPNLSSPFYAALALHIEIQARVMGYQVMLCRGKASDEDIHSLFDFLLSQRVDGILLANSGELADDLLDRYQGMVPCVLMGASPPDNAPIRLNCVSTDNYAGGMMAARYLHGLGHRKVIYLGMRAGSVTHEMRCGGFCAEAKRLDMQVRILHNSDPSSTIAAGYRMTKDFFKKEAQESAVFAGSDMLALGFMQAADELGVSIPEQISLLGFDDIEYAGLGRVRLTTFSQQVDQLAQSAVHLLLSLIENREPNCYTRKLLIPRLVERDSCAGPASVPKQN